MPRRPNGPIEDRPSPTQIEARVVTCEPNPRIHGFSVEEDLALHYRFPELVQVALTGAAPDEASGRAFDIALQFMAPLAIAEAPAHAAMLTRLFGARTSSLVAVASIALAERARHVVSQHRDFLVWLDTPGRELPAQYRSGAAEDAAFIERLRAALAAAGVEVSGLVGDVTRWAALFSTLHFAGLRSPDHCEAVLVLAGLAPTIAEAMAHSLTDIGRYPIQLPEFVYEDGP